MIKGKRKSLMRYDKSVILLTITTTTRKVFMNKIRMISVARATRIFIDLVFS